tara:strand:+ start:44 stop:697 length:654 start_codon:yes stop_codon:yes gene_type:complete
MDDKLKYGADTEDTIEDLVESERDPMQGQRDPRAVGPAGYRKDFGAYKAFLDNFDADPEINKPEKYIAYRGRVEPSPDEIRTMRASYFPEEDAIRLSDIDYLKEITGLQRFDVNVLDKLMRDEVITQKFYDEATRDMDVSADAQGNVITGKERKDAAEAERRAGRFEIVNTIEDLLILLAPKSKSALEEQEDRGREIFHGRFNNDDDYYEDAPGGGL